MDRPDDDCLLHIFHWLDLNQRAKLRLVSKLFRRLCDSMKIKQLVIYERNLPLFGRLPIQSQVHSQSGLFDTACVWNLNCFFRNPVLLNQMKLIKALVVYGERDTVVDFQSASFDQLTYLELHKFCFADLTVLSSPNMEHLILSDFAYKDPQIQVPKEKIVRLFGSREKMSVSFFLNGFDHVISQKIKFLSLDAKIDTNFIVFCATNGQFRSIERLAVKLSDLNALSLLNQNCLTLKRVDLLNNMGELILMLNNPESNPSEIADGLRNDLTVLLCGLRFNKQTVSTLPGLLEDLGRLLENVASQLLINLDSIRFDVLQALDRRYDLSEFYKLVHNVSGNCQTIQAIEFYKKFAHCEMITFGLDRNLDIAYFHSFLAIFPRLTTISLASSFEFEYDQRIADLLTQHNQITHLDLEIWNLRNELKSFDFLFQFARLKRLQLRLGQPVGQQLLIRLFERLRYLCSFDLSFPVVSDEDAQLSAVQQQINDRLARSRFWPEKINQMNFKTSENKTSPSLSSF